MDAVGAIVLAGGRSSRMGTDKAWLDWHGQPLVERVVRLCGRAVDGPVVVVGGAGQALPPFPAGVAVVADERPGRGPLEGLASGLRELRGRAWAAFATSTDVPLLHPAFIRVVSAALAEGRDAAVPRGGGRMYPLSAAYSLSVLGPVERQLAAGHLRASDLLAVLDVCWLEEPELVSALGQRSVEDSLVNLNTAADFERAHTLPEPLVHVDGAPVRASTLGAALTAAGRGLAGAQVRLGSLSVPPDPGFPLVDGDELALEHADPTA